MSDLVQEARNVALDLMTLASKVVEQATAHRVNAIFVDEGGMGAGVVDRLRQLLRGVLVVGVNFGGKSDRTMMGDDFPLTARKDAEMWASMRQWLATGSIPNDPELKAELAARQYGFNAMSAIQLEPKDAMKKRGLASPDNADALALTFAYPVADVAGDTMPGAAPQVMQDDWQPYRE